MTVQMGLGCLLSLGTEAWPLLQGMLEQAPSPEHARRALLMGLHASALKVRTLIVASQRQLPVCPLPSGTYWSQLHCSTCLFLMMPDLSSILVVALSFSEQR